MVAAVVAAETEEARGFGLTQAQLDYYNASRGAFLDPDAAGVSTRDLRARVIAEADSPERGRNIANLVRRATHTHDSSDLRLIGAYNGQAPAPRPQPPAPAGGSAPQVPAAAAARLPRNHVQGFERYDPLVQRYAREFGADPAMIHAIIAQESNYRPDAVSPRGAQGLMQLMPGTARDMGVQDAFDPAQNIRGGVRYYMMRLRQLNGNVDLALASYNAGLGAVQKHGGIPPFRETQQYVPEVKQRRETFAALIASRSAS
ncbi:MAG: lytic transglycosylase domain-containing protein [Chromatiaceae bacterium]|nr:MAG: lytic transglycosylase domain-containing protein [Chromatiaceae bacterium]